MMLYVSHRAVVTDAVVRCAVFRARSGIGGEGEGSGGGNGEGTTREFTFQLV